MPTVHAALAWVAVGAAVVLLAAGVATAVGRLSSYRVVDVLVLAQAAATALAALSGIATAVAVGLPRDPLHFVYGTVALVAPMAARVAVQGKPTTVVGRWVAVAALVAAGAAARSFMTGN